MKLSNVLGVVLVLGGACFTGCAASTDGTDEAASIEEAIGSDCTTVSADATVTGQFSSSGLTSPRTYDTCHHGYVVDVKNLSSSVAGAHWFLRADWADSAPTNQTDCENAQVYTIFYRKSGSSWVQAAPATPSYGQWFGDPATCPPGLICLGCLVPGSGLTNLTAGTTYRIAAGARQFDAAGHFVKTQKLKFYNFKEEVVR
jgi:hypothetical protein